MSLICSIWLGVLCCSPVLESFFSSLLQPFNDMVNILVLVLLSYFMLSCLSCFQTKSFSTWSVLFCIVFKVCICKMCIFIFSSGDYLYNPGKMDLIFCWAHASCLPSEIINYKISLQLWFPFLSALWQLFFRWVCLVCRVLSFSFIPFFLL